MNKTEMPDSGHRQREVETTCADECQKSTQLNKWPWLAQFLLALVIIIAVLVLLVGLPTVSMLVAKKMSSGSELYGTVSFWGALFAAFISLVVTFIAGVFAFTAFKVEGNAAQEARRTAIEETNHTVKREIQNKMAEPVRSYVEEKDPDGDGKSTRGQTAARLAADGYFDKYGKEIIRAAADHHIKIYLEKNGNGITQEAAVAYVEDNGEMIVRTEATNYVEKNGERIAGKAAANYVGENGKRITEGAADIFLDKNGERITMERIDNYIKEVSSVGDMSRGEKVVQQTVNDYVANLVDSYIGKGVEGEKTTKIEQMSKDLVETFHAEEIARLVDERLVSFSFADMLKLRFSRGSRQDESDSFDKG